MLLSTVMILHLDAVRFTGLERFFFIRAPDDTSNGDFDLTARGRRYCSM